MVAGATTLPGGKHATGFSVAYGSLRIQFLCHPPQFGGAAKGKRLNGQARRLTSPHLEVLCRTSTGDYKAPLCCELLMKGLLFRALLSHSSAGGRWCRKAPKGECISSPAGRLYGFIQTGAFYNLEAPSTTLSGRAAVSRVDGIRLLCPPLTEPYVRVSRIRLLE